MSYKPITSTPRSHTTGTRSQPSTKSQTTGAAFIDEGLGRLVANLKLPQDNPSSIVRVEDVEPISSYSWVETPKQPTIYVPGAPRVWANSNPTRVPQDAGLVFIDQNSHRMGTKSPLIPLFKAVDTYTNNSFDYTSVDIVSDRNGLRKILRWASSSPELEDFRIDIDKAGSACLFTRVEAMAAEIVTGFRGFGFEYEKASTKPVKGLENATGHHRIISLDFGGINILLRFEVDACELRDDQDVGEDDDDLVSALKNLGFKQPPAKQSTQQQDITVKRSTIQTLVPQSSLIEMSTRAAHKAFDWHEKYPQMYLSNTGLCYLARHTRGVFGSVEKTRLADMDQQAALAQRGMAKLKAALLSILVAVRGADGSQFSLVCKNQQLRLYERSEGTGKSIPSEFLEKFIVSD